MLRRIKRYFRYEYLLFMRLKGNPHQIARGVAVGASINFLPTMGLGIFLAYFIAGLLRTNRTATVLSNMAIKAGIPFFYAMDIALGDYLLGYRDEGLRALFSEPFHWQAVAQTGESFLLGSVVNTVVVGIFLYFSVLSGIRQYRQKRTICEKHDN